MEFIPERLDVAFVKTCMLPYLARYIPKWANYDPNSYSTNRDNNRDCVKIYDGFRAVWNKWKKEKRH